MFRRFAGGEAGSAALASATEGSHWFAIAGHAQDRTCALLARVSPPMAQIQRAILRPEIAGGLAASPVDA